MNKAIIVDTLRLAYQYLGKAVADGELANCAKPVESAYKQVGLVLAELEGETSNILEPPKTGAQLIVIERERQMSDEGWDAEHDDQHIEGELALVAALYASPKPLFEMRKHGNGVIFVDPWPWFDTVEVTRYGDGLTTEVKAWDKRKKHNKLRKLVIAGALIAAEIDRLQRIEAKVGATQ